MQVCLQLLFMMTKKYNHQNQKNNKHNKMKIYNQCKIKNNHNKRLDIKIIVIYDNLIKLSQICK